MVVQIIEELRRRGLRVASVKHTTHSHAIDEPGKDSFRHREAGAEPAAVVTADGFAVFGGAPPGVAPLDALAPLLGDVDLVIVEGYVAGPGRKVEVYRTAVNPRPVFSEHPGIEAVITDDPVETDLPVWPRGDLKTIVDGVLAIAAR